MKYKYSLITLVVFLLTSFSLWASPGVGSGSDPAATRLSNELKKRFPQGVSLKVEPLGQIAAVPAEAELISLLPDPPLGIVSFQFFIPHQPPIIGRAVVRATGKIAVAKVPIQTGETLSEEKVRYDSRELSPYSHAGYFLEGETLSGLKSHGYIHPGAVINGSNARKELAVSPGQQIELIHKEGSLQTSARVLAQEGGKVGDWIMVENPQSKKKLRARVTRPGEAETR